jgi:Kef-type K+ transport system membrane component KefB
LLEFFVALFLMLATARALGELVRRAKQPSLVGELLAGMLLGTSVLNIVQPTGDLTTMTNFSLFFIMLLTGLNLNSRDIISVGGKAVLLSLPAFILPLVLGTVGASAYGLGLRESLAVGLTLAITAVPVNSIILMDLGILKTRLGSTVLTAGVIDDQMALILLGVILQLPATGNAFTLDYVSLLLSIGKVLLFVGGILFVDRLLRKNPQWVRSLLPKVTPRLLARETGFALLIIFGLGVALVAEALGLHFIIGAYFAGILLNQAIGDVWLTRSMSVFSGVTFGILAPLLFVFIGIQLNPYAVAGVLALFVTLLLIGIGGKMAGGYLGARLGGFSPADSRIIGALLNSRGMVELVIASIVYQAGLVDLALFSVVVGIGIITTVMSAVLARLALSAKLGAPVMSEGVGYEGGAGA